jgi:hypothetical protein
MLLIASQAVNVRNAGKWHALGFIMNSQHTHLLRVLSLFLLTLVIKVDHPFGLVFRVSGYRSRGPCSILGATRFSEI